MVSSSSTFSPSSSTERRFDTSIFDGFRVLFNFSVVYSHVMYFMPMILDSPEPPFLLNAPAEPILSLLSVSVYFLMLYSVDVFLFLSGYLFANSFCSRTASDLHHYTVLHGVNHMFNRFLRLLPVFAIVWAIGFLRGSHPCRTHHTLYEFFHMFNCNPAYGKASPPTSICVLVAWSLSADVQAHAFMAAVLVFFKSHKRTVHFLCFAVLVQVLCRAQFLYALGRPLMQGPTMVSVAQSYDEIKQLAKVLNMPVGNIRFDDGLGQFNRQLLTDMKVYASPYMRTAPAFIGFLTWYAVHERTAYVRFIEKRLTASLISILVGTMALLLSFFAIPTLDGYPRWLCIMHESVHRVVFTCIFSAFVVVLGSPMVSPKSQLVRAFRFMFSNLVANRIAQLSYAIYLVHPYLVWLATVIPPRITPTQFEMWRFVPSGVQVYLAAVILAVPCHYLENRFHVVRKQCTNRQLLSSGDSTTKKD